VTTASPSVGINDFQATFLHILGMIMNALHSDINVRDFRLTYVGGAVVKDILV